MEYTRLYLWVEGADDRRFVERIVVPLLEAKVDFVKIVPYARETKKWIANFLKSIEAMGADYVFFTDNDRSPCVTARKQKTMDEYRQVDRVQVVVEEIESWYLAGLDDKSSGELRVRSFRTTDTISKEQFDSLVPERFDSRIDFMLENIKYFVKEVAVTKNVSFNYFFSKYISNRCRQQ